MNIVTLIRKKDGREFQGFLDWDGMTRQVNFYFYDDELDGWTSEKLGDFKPVPKIKKDENRPNVIGE